MNTALAQPNPPELANPASFERVPGRRGVVWAVTVLLLALIALGAGSWWRQLKAQRREALQELVLADTRRMAAINAQIATLQEAYDTVERQARNLNLYDWEVQSRLLAPTRTITYGQRVTELEQDNAGRLERIRALRRQLVTLAAELGGAQADLKEK